MENKTEEPKRYKVRYGRVVICERTFEATDQEDAETKAMAMENNGDLALSDLVTANKEIEIDAVVDYEEIWEIDEVDIW